MTQRRDTMIARLSAMFDAVLFDSPWLNVDLRVELGEKYGIAFIPVLSLRATCREIAAAIKGCSGFIYLMCSASTGGHFAREDDIQRAIARIKSQTALPVCCGFGVRTALDIHSARRAGADGVIVGTALLKALARDTTEWKQMLCELMRACTTDALPGD